MKAIHALTMTAVALALSASQLPAQDTVPPATRPRARLGIHPPGTGLQPGVTPMHQRLGFNRSAWGARGLGAGFGLGQGQCCPPRGLLAQREFLGLSEEQVSQLEGLDTELAETHLAAMERARLEQQELQSLWGADSPDASAIRARTQRMLEAEQDARLAAVDAAARSRAILTPEQQGKIQGFAQGRRMGVRRGVGVRGSRGMTGGRMGVGRRGTVGRRDLPSMGRGRAGVRRAPIRSRPGVPPQIQ